jgi:hypothetical protein
VRGENTGGLSGFSVFGFRFSVFGFALRSRHIARRAYRRLVFFNSGVPNIPSHFSRLTSHFSAFSPYRPSPYRRLVFFNFRRFDITPCVLKKLPHPSRECARPPARLPIDL